MPRGRTLSLLALLLVHRGSIVHVDRAVDELWGGADPQHGRKAVQVLASRLRAALDEGVLVTEGGGYALRPPAGSLDADRFEALLRRGRAELAGGEPHEAAATLRQALALWRGPALADVAERALRPAGDRRGSRTLRLACLADRIDADLACGRHEELVGELEALVQQHPLRRAAARPADARALPRRPPGGRARRLPRRLRGARRRARHRAVGRAARRWRPRSCATTLPAPAARRSEPPLPLDVRRRVTCAFAQLAPPRSPALDAESLRARLERDREPPPRRAPAHGGSVGRGPRRGAAARVRDAARARGRRPARPARAAGAVRGDALAPRSGSGRATWSPGR